MITPTKFKRIMFSRSKLITKTRQRNLQISTIDPQNADLV